MERTEATEDDEGKAVVNAKGEKIGIVSEVKNGAAYVNPDPSITDSIKSRLGWRDADEDDYRLGPRRIGKITDEELHIKP